LPATRADARSRASSDPASTIAFREL